MEGMGPGEQAFLGFVLKVVKPRDEREFAGIEAATERVDFFPSLENDSLGLGQAVQGPSEGGAPAPRRQCLEGVSRQKPHSILHGQERPSDSLCFPYAF